MLQSKAPVLSLYRPMQYAYGVVGTARGLGSGAFVGLGSGGANVGAGALGPAAVVVAALPDSLSCRSNSICSTLGEWAGVSVGSRALDPRCREAVSSGTTASGEVTTVVDLDRRAGRGLVA